MLAGLVVWHGVWLKRLSNKIQVNRDNLVAQEEEARTIRTSKDGTIEAEHEREVFRQYPWRFPPRPPGLGGRRLQDIVLRTIEDEL